MRFSIVSQKWRVGWYTLSVTSTWSPALTVAISAIVTAARPEGTMIVPAAPVRSVQALSSEAIVGVPLVP